MKILIINPNSDEKTNEIIKKKANAFVNGNYEVDVKCLSKTPKLVSSYEDIALGTDEMIDLVREGTEYDAFIVACHSDPNLDLLKEISQKPVVGIAEASMKSASMAGNSFAVISPSVKSISKKMALARKYHCESLFKATRVSSSNELEDIFLAAKAAVKEDHVDCIVLGCANYANADKYCEEKLHVPVLDGVACALFMASGLAQYHQYKTCKCKEE